VWLAVVRKALYGTARNRIGIAVMARVAVLCAYIVYKAYGLLLGFAMADNRYKARTLFGIFCA